MCIVLNIAKAMNKSERKTELAKRYAQKAIAGSREVRAKLAEAYKAGYEQAIRDSEREKSCWVLL